MGGWLRRDGYEERRRRNSSKKKNVVHLVKPQPVFHEQDYVNPSPQTSSFGYSLPYWRNAHAEGEKGKATLIFQFRRVLLYYYRPQLIKRCRTKAGSNA